MGREGREIQISIYRHQNPALSILQREGKQRLGYPDKWYSQSTTSMFTKGCTNSCGLSVHKALSYTGVVLPAETTCIILCIIFNLESKLQLHFLRAILKTNNRGNTDQLVTRCENRAVSAQSPTDRAQIFSVSTSHLQHKHSFHAFVRSANLGKLQCTSKERCDEIT